MAKLIIGFDNWTGGLSHFERLVQRSKKSLNLNFYILKIGLKQ